VWVPEGAPLKEEQNGGKIVENGGVLIELWSVKRKLEKLRKM
jgi:hypothetical protein